IRYRPALCVTVDPATMSLKVTVKPLGLASATWPDKRTVWASRTVASRERVGAGRVKEASAASDVKPSLSVTVACTVPEPVTVAESGRASGREGAIGAAVA